MNKLLNFVLYAAAGASLFSATYGLVLGSTAKNWTVAGLGAAVMLAVAGWMGLLKKD